MLSLIGWVVLAVVLAGVLYLLAANFLPAGEQIAPPLRDEAPWELPAAQRLDSSDVANVRLPVALRGYRFAETDQLLDRLAEEIRQRDEEIARLRGAPPAASIADVPTAEVPIVPVPPLVLEPPTTSPPLVPIVLEPPSVEPEPSHAEETAPSDDW